MQYFLILLEILEEKDQIVSHSELYFTFSWLTVKIKCFTIYQEIKDGNYCLNHQKVKYTNSFISLTYDTNYIKNNK